MKIGIFGDSFAYCKHNDTPTWSEILNQKHQVTNYGHPGSNLYWSITEFLKFKYNFDKIIFIMTVPGRLLIPRQVAEQFQLEITHVPNIDTALYFLNTYQYKQVEKNILGHCVDYFKYLSDNDYDEYIHELMKKDLLNYKTDDILFVDIESIADVTNEENKTVGFGQLEAPTAADIRNCHMTDVNNAIYAEIISNWIETGNYDFSASKFDYRIDNIKKFIKQK